jgi:transposase
LTDVEEVFRTLKSELDVRPIWHRIQHRVEAHILVAFLSLLLVGSIETKVESRGRRFNPGASAPSTQTDSLG